MDLKGFGIRFIAYMGVSQNKGYLLEGWGGTTKWLITFWRSMLRSTICIETTLPARDEN